LCSARAITAAAKSSKIDERDTVDCRGRAAFIETGVIHSFLSIAEQQRCAFYRSYTLHRLVQALTFASTGLLPKIQYLSE
jgi:hypothetical protein